MSHLVVVGFSGPDTADQALNKLNALRKEHLIDLEDACVVVRDASGKVQMKQQLNLMKLGAASGATWGGLFGVLVGVLFLNPLAGAATGVVVGAATGALSGRLADYGINDDFIGSMGATITPNTSALFVLVRRVNLDKVLPELDIADARILHTSLTNEQETRLKAALQRASASREAPAA